MQPSAVFLSRSHTPPAAAAAAAMQPSSTACAEDRNMFVFGLGYTGLELGKRLLKDGWKVSGTCRSLEKKCLLKDKYGLDSHVFADSCSLKDDGLEALFNATHLVSCVPPHPEFHTDTVLQNHIHDIKQAWKLGWIGYVSSTGVYGDYQGGWVDESSQPKPDERKAEARLEAEMSWLQLNSSSVQIFRAGGIYGPGRSALDSVSGNQMASTKKLSKRDFRRFTSRVHVADLCQAIQASMASPQHGRIYNVVDDDPAPRLQVIQYATKILKIEPPDVGDAEQQVSSIHVSEKRVMNRRMKEELGVELLFPSYREGLISVLEQEKKEV